MPKKPRGPGRKFKPGQSGNPEGRPPLPLEVKLLRRVNERQYRKTMTRLMSMDAHQLELYLNGPKHGVPMHDRICARAVQEAEAPGGHVQRREIWNRLVGPPIKRVEVTSNGTALPSKGITREELLAVMAQDAFIDVTPPKQLEGSDESKTGSGNIG